MFNSADSFRSRHIQRMVDQRLHAFEEVRRVRHSSVRLERSLVCPLFKFSQAPRSV
jgi:hypothetical protein